MNKKILLFLALFSMAVFALNSPSEESSFMNAISSGLPIAGLAVVLALFLGVIMKKAGQFSALGYIFAGIILGPVGFALLQPGIGVSFLFGQLGLFLLMFYLGLEMDLGSLKKTGAFAVVVGSMDMLFAWIAGFFISMLFFKDMLLSAIIASFLPASSTVVSVSYILENKLARTAEARITMAILVMQDFLAILMLVFITSFSTSTSINTLVINALFFVIATLFVVSKLSKHVLTILDKFGYTDQMAIYALGVGIVVAYLGNFLGLPPTLGAYFAGTALAETAYGEKIKRKLGFLREFFILFFFVSFGSEITISFSPILFLLLVSLIAVFIIGKMVVPMMMGTAMGLKEKSALTVGLLLVPIGEFSMLIAQAAKNGNLIHAGSYFIPSDLLGLSFLLVLVSASIAPSLYANADKIASLFMRFYPKRIRRALQKVRFKGAHVEKVMEDKLFKEEFSRSLESLFTNILIVVAIAYLSYVINVRISLPALPMLPKETTLGLLILPLILWPIFQFITELKIIVRKLINALINSAFPTVGVHVSEIMQYHISNVFTGILLSLIGIGASIFTYYYAGIFLTFIPLVYSILAIMYLSRSFYSLAEYYETLELEVSQVNKNISRTSALLSLSDEFNSHSELFTKLYAERKRAKEQIQEALHLGNYARARRILLEFKRKEMEALVGMLDYDALLAHMHTFYKITPSPTKEAFRQYLKARLPNLAKSKISKTIK